MLRIIVQLGPLVRQMMPVVQASPVYSLARNASGTIVTCLC